MKKEKKVKKTYKKENQPKQKEAIIKSLSNGTTIGEALEAAGVESYTTYYKWLKEDKVFKEAVKKSEQTLIQSLEDAAVRTARGGNPTMLIFLLCNKAPDRFKSVNHQVLTFSKEIEEGKKVLAEALDDMQKEARSKNA